MRHGREVGFWHHDRIGLDELREDLVFRRALLADENGNMLHNLRQFLAVAALLLRKIWENQWLVAESLTNRWRLQMLEEAQASWEGLGPPFPQFAAHDQERVDEILESLVAGLRQRCPRDDELAEDNAERLQDASDNEEEAPKDQDGDDSGEEAPEDPNEA